MMSWNSNTQQLRILTWNCQGGFFNGDPSKSDVVAALGADVEIIQECPRPRHTDAKQLWIGDAIKGVLIRASGPFTLTELPRVRSSPKWFYPVQVQGPIPFNLIGVWAKPAIQPPSYVRTLLQGVYAYRELIRSGPTVIAGDFNSNSRFVNAFIRRGHDVLVSRLAKQFNLYSAYHVYHQRPPRDEHHHTHFFRRKADNGYHIDYVFLPEKRATQIVEVTVGSYAKWAARSDHCPMMVRLGREPVRSQSHLKATLPGEQSDRRVNQSDRRQLVSRIRRMPNKAWAEAWLDLLHRLFRHTGLIEADPSLVTSMPKVTGRYRLVPTTINRRWVIVPIPQDQMIALILSREDANHLKHGGIEFEFRPTSRAEERPPVMVRWNPLTPMPMKLMHAWLHAANSELERCYYSNYWKHHRPVVHRAVCDEEFRCELLSEAFSVL
ncbi:MAG: endonuclease/exonuclease/phosphatase family protein [Phycisphaeraceae bacterium]